MGSYSSSIDQDAAVVLFIDHQSGLSSLVREPSLEQLRNGIIALADFAKYFSLPTVLTTSCDESANGPLIRELAYAFPASPLIRRKNKLSAWDDRDVAAAVQATGRRQLLVSAVLMEACATSAVLGAIADGYEVYVVADTSGNLTKSTRLAAWNRMSEAGALIVDWYSVACELSSTCCAKREA